MTTARTQSRLPIVFGIVALLLMGLYVFAHHWRVSINVTPSLPGHVYLIDLMDKTPVKDRLIAFRAENMAPIPDDVTVIKLVKGVADDVITVIDREVHVNGEFVAKAKSRAMSGEALEVIASQTIAKGSFFVWAPHPDSFDSRYQTPGLISTHQIIGTARELF